MPRVFTLSEKCVSIMARLSAFSARTVIDVVLRALRSALSAAVPAYPLLISFSMSAEMPPPAVWALIPAGMSSTAAAAMASLFIFMSLCFSNQSKTCMTAPILSLRHQSHIFPDLSTFFTTKVRPLLVTTSLRLVQVMPPFTFCPSPVGT